MLVDRVENGGKTFDQVDSTSICSTKSVRVDASCASQDQEIIIEFNHR